MPAETDPKTDPKTLDPSAPTSAAPSDLDPSAPTSAAPSDLDAETIRLAMEAHSTPDHVAPAEHVITQGAVLVPIPTVPSGGTFGVTASRPEIRHVGTVRSGEIVAVNPVQRASMLDIADALDKWTSARAHTLLPGDDASFLYELSHRIRDAFQQ